MRLLRTLIVFFGSLPVAAIAEDCLHFGAPNLTLHGRVIKGERQTAVGYETGDDRDYYWYLQFTAPICVSGKGSDTVKGATKASLWLPKSGSSLGSWDGRTVRAKGRFAPTYMPHYHSYLIFVAANLEIVEQVPRNASLERTQKDKVPSPNARKRPAQLNR